MSDAEEAMAEAINTATECFGLTVRECDYCAARKSDSCWMAARAALQAVEAGGKYRIVPVELNEAMGRINGSANWAQLLAAAPKVTP